jgi:S1-C subfamily serine protease
MERTSPTTQVRIVARASLLGAWLAFGVAGLLMAASVVGAGDGSLPSATLKAVKKATVYLHVTIDDARTIEGSGFFASEPGIVLTNAHVVGMLKPDMPYPQRIEAILNSGESDEQTCMAEIIGIDRDADLAVLRVEGKDLPSPLTGDSRG